MVRRRWQADCQLTRAQRSGAFPGCVGRRRQYRLGEWVMWTPQGYCTGSAGADKIVGWQINKGPENAANYVGADQLREHLNRPDIIDKAIILASAEQAVRESPGTSFKLTDLLTKPVPRFRIVLPAPHFTLRGGRAQIKIAIEAVPGQSHPRAGQRPQRRKHHA